MSIPMSSESFEGMGEVVSWSNPQGLFGKIALMTSDRIVFGNPSDESEIAAAIEAFKRDATLPQRAEVIRLESIYQIRYNEKSTSMSVIYAEESSEGKKYDYDFGDNTARNSFVEMLVEHFGERFEPRVKKLNAVTASFKPLFFSGLIALFTWLFHMASVELVAGREASFSGRHAGTKRLVAWAIELIGPTGVLIVGGVALAISLVALFRRASNPPTFRFHSRKR